MPAFRVTKPRFRARRTTTTTFAAGQHPLPVDVVDYEEPAGWDGTGYTVSRDGLYLVAAAAAWSAIASASRAVIYVAVDGVTKQQFEAISTAGFVTVATSCHLLIEEGQRVEPLAQRSPTLSSTLEFRQTFFEVLRAGPWRWT